MPSERKTSWKGFCPFGCCDKGAAQGALAFPSHSKLEHHLLHVHWKELPDYSTWSLSGKGVVGSANMSFCRPVIRYEDEDLVLLGATESRLNYRAHHLGTHDHYNQRISLSKAPSASDGAQKRYTRLRNNDALAMLMVLTYFSNFSGRLSAP